MSGEREHVEDRWGVIVRIDFISKAEKAEAMGLGRSAIESSF